MIRINLIPTQIDFKPTQINPVLPLGIAAIIPVIFLVPIHLKQSADQKRLQGEIASLRSELDRYQPISAQVDALESAQNQLKQRKSIIEQIQSERLRYPQFMDDFVKLLPGNLWLTNLTTVQQPTGDAMTISMDVVSLDNYAIADLISNLETSQIFTDVDLGSISSSQASNGTQSATFHISANYKKMTPVLDANKKS